MSNWNSRKKRRADVNRRASKADPMYSYCRAIGCSQPARAGTGDGLDRRYCRRHADHHQRHGSPFVGSYRADVVNPYRRAALEWLLLHLDDFWVQHAIRSVQDLYRRAGRFEEAFRLRGLPPRDRARVHWARLRQHQVDTRLIVAVWLGVEMAVIEDTQAPSGVEYKRVQAAKIVHRMASGTHKRWGNHGAAGTNSNTRVTELHVYPNSRGRILRHIGKDLERACEGLTDHVPDVLAFKAELEAAGRLGSRPYPKSSRVRRRSV